jgi:hypothetical protein
MQRSGLTKTVFIQTTSLSSRLIDLMKCWYISVVFARPSFA